MADQPNRKPSEEMPEQMAPPAQGRDAFHRPLTDELIDPEDADGDIENTAPDEMDACGNVLEHEGEWTQEPAGDLTDEDTADTRDWRGVPVDPHSQGGWQNEKKPE